MYFRSGEMAEWSNAAVLKTVDRESGPGVRIPLSPLVVFAILRKEAIKPENICVFGLFCFRGFSRKTQKSAIKCNFWCADWCADF